jgi:hypothetical protein
MKHCAANSKRRLSALPNVGPYIYDVKISALQAASYIYDISGLRVKTEINMAAHLIRPIIQLINKEIRLVNLTKIKKSKCHKNEHSSRL